MYLPNNSNILILVNNELTSLVISKITQSILIVQSLIIIFNNMYKL